MKKLMKILPIIMIVCMVFTSVFADVDTDFSNLGQGQQGSANIITAAKKVWGTLTVIIQILALAAVVFAGVRYMFASADKKADIKTGMMTLAIGAVLVFGATTVIKFIVSAVDDIL